MHCFGWNLWTIFKKNSIRSKYLVIVSSELKEDWVVDGKVSSLKDDLVLENV